MDEYDNPTCRLQAFADALRKIIANKDAPNEYGELPHNYSSETIGQLDLIANRALALAVSVNHVYKLIDGDINEQDFFRAHDNAGIEYNASIGYNIEFTDDDYNKFFGCLSENDVSLVRF